MELKEFCNKNDNVNYYYYMNRRTYIFNLLIYLAHQTRFSVDLAGNIGVYIQHTINVSILF